MTFYRYYFDKNLVLRRFINDDIMRVMLLHLGLVNKYFKRCFIICMRLADMLSDCLLVKAVNKFAVSIKIAASKLSMNYF